MDIYGNPHSCYESTADCLPKAWASMLESCQLSFDSTELYTPGRSMKPSAQNQLKKMKSIESLSWKGELASFFVG